MHLSALGKTGIQKLANLNVQKAHYAADQIGELDGFELAFSSPFFNEFVIKSSLSPQKINTELLKHKILGGLDLGGLYPELKNHMLLCVTETKTKEDIDRFVSGLEGII